MTISIGDKVPDANLLRMGENGPEAVELGPLLTGKTVIFGLPGAYTGVCSTAHMPSFVRSADAFRAKGVDQIICVSVNDPFVLAAWAKETGADGAGISVLGDADGSLTAAMGLDFTAPPAGLLGRSKRYGMIVEAGKVTALDVEDSPGECTVSAGEALLEKV